MKRLHIHLKTNDLEGSIAFYAALFGEEPTRREDDYAKWLLDDPRAHISISTHGGETGIDHAGISVETNKELHDIADRIHAISAPTFSEEETTCCYAQSNKVWATSPEAARWELFQTFASADTYGEEPDRNIAPAATPATKPQNCCAPSAS